MRIEENSQDAPIHAAKKLMRVICEQFPVKISLNKLRKVDKTIKLIDLAWLLAIHDSKYPNFGAVDQDSNNLYCKLNDAAQFYLNLLDQKVNLLLPQKIDQIHPWYIPDTAILSFKVRPNLLAKILASEKELKYLFHSESQSVNVGTAGVSSELVETLIPSVDNRVGIALSTDTSTAFIPTAPTFSDTTAIVNPTSPGAHEGNDVSFDKKSLYPDIEPQLLPKHSSVCSEMTQNLCRAIESA